MLAEWTNIIGVDAKHIAELAVSLPTWRRFYPEIFEGRRRTLLLVHAEAARDAEWAVAACGGAERCVVLPVMPQNGWTHRELMLTALVFAPLHVRTEYFLKIDTDAIAVSREEGWACECWFARKPVYVAPPWGYTKPGTFLEVLDRWSDEQPDLFGLPKPARQSGERVASHRRCISWLYFGRTDWHAALAARFCRPLAADDRLPVPSQDTITSYMANLMGEHVAYRQMKHWGWRHVSGGVAGIQRAINERVASNDG